MARRAQQGSVAHCPYCEASLPQVAAECPECRFPLTMAAADSGFRSPDRTGTTSTATPGGRWAPPVLPDSHAGAARARAHGSRGHRMRMTALLLAVTSILLLLAGIGALFTASSSGATSDRLAQTSLLNALRATAGVTDPPPPPGITVLAPDEPSEAPEKVSLDMPEGSWFGAARSASGTCYLLAVRLADGGRVPGTLAKNEPCTGAQVRLRTEEKLTKSKP